AIAWAAPASRLRKGTRELPLELGHFLRAEPDGDRLLSRFATVGTGADDQDGAARLGYRPDNGLDRRRVTHAAVEGGVVVWIRLCGVLPQHAAARAIVPVVLRAAGVVAEECRPLAEATTQRAILDGGGRHRLFHVGARCRAIAGRHRLAAAWPEAGGHRAWPHHGADLSLRAAADGVSHHPAAADLGVHQHAQEHIGCHHHRLARAHRPSPLHGGIFLPGFRGLHRGNGALSPDQPRHRDRDAPARAGGGDPRLYFGEIAMIGNFDFDVIWRSLPYLFRDGMTFTLLLTALSAAGGLVFGTLIALMRLSGYRVLGLIAGLYVDFMRTLPLVLVIFWFYFLVPYIAQWLTGAASPIRVGAFHSSLITFIMFEASYFSEIMRAGIQSISRGQPAAAQALGLTYGQTMRYVVLPQAFRNMLPVLLTQTIVLFQDTSLVYVLSITDFLGAASKVAQRDGRLVEMYLFAAAVYFIISCFASFGVRRLQARIAFVH